MLNHTAYLTGKMLNDDESSADAAKFPNCAVFVTGFAYHQQNYPAHISQKCNIHIDQQPPRETLPSGRRRYGTLRIIG